MNEAGILFIGATESLLGSDQLGYVRVNNCFYRKAARESVGKRPVRVGEA